MKKKVLICSECGENGYYAIDCPNESNCRISGEIGITWPDVLLNQHAKKLINFNKLI